MSAQHVDVLTGEILEPGMPAYATAPTPGLRHEQKQIELVARALGTPLMPWQSQVARVASERNPNDPRRFRYPIVVLTVPRQCGKTTLMRAVLTQRALMYPRRVAFYTAQTGKDATARWMDLVKQIESGPLAGRVHKRLSAGSQGLRFPTESTISPFAPTPKSLHGYTPHDVMCDEIFAFDAAAGEDLMGAIKPAQITLPDRQLWLVSTMGTKDSEFLHGWVDQGRAATADPGAGIAYFEWSMPEGLDPYDPASWAFHPALGHTITTEDLSEAAQAHTAGDWMRAYMNRRSAAVETFVDMGKYDGAANHEQRPAPWGETVIAYEADPQRRRAAIVAAWMQDGKAQLRVVESRDGVEWLPAAVAELFVEKRPAAIGADDAGATRATTDRLRKLPNRRTGADGVTVEVLGSRDYATACGEWRGGIEDGTVQHGASPRMREAVEAAATRPMGEAWAISRAKSAGPIPELIASVVALRLLGQRPTAKPKPLIFGGGE